jgi:phage gpG-like protein
MQDFINRINELNNFLQNDVQDIVGTEAVNHFKQSFHDEAFSDKSEKDMPWQEVKRRQSSKNSGKAAATRKILTGETGDLGDSISYEKENRDVAIKSDKIYAQVHNEGLKAGRGKGFMMPKRPFIRKSVMLINNISSKVKTRITNIMKS